MRSREWVENQAAARRGNHYPLLQRDRNASWKGDEASNSAIHKWLNTWHPRRGICDHCGRQDTRTGYAFIRHGEPYTRDPLDYVELCGSCHKRLDGWANGWGTTRPLATHCKHGHELAGDNLGYEKYKSGARRICLECRRERGRRWYQRKREANL